MTSEQLHGKWEKMKVSAKQQWGRLTGDDLEAIDGDRDLLIRKLQQRYGVTKDVATKDADAWFRLNGGSPAHELHPQYAGKH